MLHKYHKNYFYAGDVKNIVYLPYKIDEYLRTWSNLRQSMIKHHVDSFARDEWAYLITFLEESNLRNVFATGFGSIVKPDRNTSLQKFLFYPRGQIAIWLPNNVSLLGPLSLILCSLTGQKVILKVGSRSNNLTSDFITYLKNYLPQSELLNYINNNVSCASFNKDDSRNIEMSTSSKVRIIFGSDASAQQIESLPHSIDSITFKFVDKYSEIWLEHNQIDQNIITQIIKVFSIYGQLGCTSPKKVILINASQQQLVELHDKLITAWSTISKSSNNEVLPMHIASKNIQIMQLAKAYGCESSLVKNNQATVAYGPLDKISLLKSDMCLPLGCTSVENALKNLPDNVQTIGYALSDTVREYLIDNLPHTFISRIVPINRMHYFNSVWDGNNFWKQLFTQTEYYD